MQTSEVINNKESMAVAIAELIIHFEWLVNSHANASDLNMAQWSAIRFVDQSPVNVRNIGSFARLRRTTPSSASQTIGSLIKRGYLRKVPGLDRRVSTLELTAKGKAALPDDPIQKVINVCRTLPDEQIGTMAQVMERLIRTILQN